MANTIITIKKENPINAVIGNDGPRIFMKNIIDKETITINNSQTSQIKIINTANSNVKTTIETSTAIGVGSTKLSSMNDVNTSIATDGSVLTYDSASNNYVFEPIDLKNVKVNLDGGNF